MQQQSIAIELIDEPENAHRITFDEDELQGLTESIAAHGLIQPIIVRPRKGRYEIIAGHRRYLASRRARLTHMPAMIAEDQNDAQTEAIRAIENLQRSQLSPLEECRLVYQLYAVHNYDVERIAKQLSRSNAWVETRIQLGEIPEDLVEDLHNKKLPISHALLLAKIDDETHRNYLHEYARRDGVTTNILRHWVDEWLLAKAEGLPYADALPAMPPPGNLADIQLPCGLCGTYTDYRSMPLIRTCQHCAGLIGGGIPALCAACKALEDDE